MADPAEVTITVDPTPEPPAAEAVADAAERVVAAAETAVVLAEGQAAIATQQAAIVATDAEQAAEAASDSAAQAVAVVGEVARTMEERMSWLETELNDCRRMILELTTPLIPSPPSSEMDLTTVTLETPEGTTSLTTPTDTLDQTVETLTGPSGSGAGSAVAEATGVDGEAELIEGVPVAGPRLRRWI